MWSSARYMMTRLQMSRRKENGPPPKPNPMDGSIAALWDLVMHVNGRVDKLHALIVSVALTLGAGVAAILVTVLVR